jgi:putative transcriptional regulator
LSKGQLRSEAGLAKGRFLIASEQLEDPNFSKTVVLLTDYGAEGAVGLVVNRPTQVKLGELFPEIEGLGERLDTVFFGGPVSGNMMQLLIRSAGQPEESRRVFEDIYVSSSRDLLERMIARLSPGEKFRLYAGYAGWFPGQLEREVSLGAWHVVEAEAEMIFSKKPLEVWHELISRASAKWVKALSDPKTRSFPNGRWPLFSEKLF